MSFIRRVLSHSFLILLIVGAALAWYYRAAIFPDADKKAGQDVAQNEAEGVVTVKSSDELVEQKQISAGAGADENADADADEKSGPQGQTVFGGNPQTNTESSQASQVDLTKYRPLTPPDNTGTETDNNETEDATAASEATTAAETQAAEAPPPGSRGAAADIATATGITAAGGAATLVPAQQVAEQQAAEVETPPTDTDTGNQTATVETPAAEPEFHSAVTETSPATPDSQVTPADTTTIGQAPASVENAQPTGQPVTHPDQTQASTAYPGGHLPLPPPVFPEPEPLSQEEKKLLSSARQAFWQRDTEKAEKDYQSLIAMNSASPDPYGELGNVYYSTGQWGKAAEMYSQAGERLIDRKQYREAMHLVSVLRGLDAERARALEKALNDALPRPDRVSTSPEQSDITGN